MKRLERSVSRPLMMVALSLLAIPLLGAQARADEGLGGDPASHTPSVSRLSEEGLVLYKARDYRHAAEKFLQAYALDQDPNLLFNLARCYEGLGDRENALEKYEAFIAKPDADPQGKQRAAEAIRKLRQAKAHANDPVKSTAPMSPHAAATETAPIHAADRDEHSFLTAPMIFLGAGVIVAVAGGVVYAMGASDHSQVTGSAGFGMPGQVDPMTESSARKLVQSGDTKKLIGGIAMGVGGALLATSAVLFVTGSNHGTTKETGNNVALGAVPLTSGGALLLQGRF